MSEVLSESPEALVTYLQHDWRDDGALRDALVGCSAVVHTAGPYADEQPDVLRAAIAKKVPVYVDLR